MNFMFPYSNVAPTLPVQQIAPLRSPQNVLNGKERDNTWLQLPVCPNLTKKPDEREECPEDAKCRSNYGHPPNHVLEHLLTSGYIVCCQAYIFANFGSAQTPERPGCSRGEAACKYYHPPEHLSLLVINAGRNNKRLRSEVTAKLKLAATASAQSAPATVHPASPAVTSSNLVTLSSLTPSYNSLTSFCYPQVQQHQLAMSSMQQIQNVVPYLVHQHQNQPTVTINNQEPLPPGIQQFQEEETHTVTKRKRQISPRPRGTDERSPEPKRRSLSLVPDQQQPRMAQAYHQPLQSPYFLSPPATTLSPAFSNSPIYLLPGAQTPQLTTWPYDPVTMASYFQSTM